MKVKLVMLFMLLAMIVGCSQGPSTDEMKQAMYNELAHQLKLKSYGVYRLEGWNIQKFEVLKAMDKTKDGTTYYFREIHLISSMEIRMDHVPVEMTVVDEVLRMGFVKQGNTWYAKYLKQ